jgi:hypothetical protein
MPAALIYERCGRALPDDAAQPPGNWSMFKQLAALTFAALLASGPTAHIAGAQGGLTAPHEASLPKPDADGFIALFNGRDLSGWAGLPDYWSVTEGSIRGKQAKETSKQTFLVFAGLRVKDFELRLKYRFASPEGNSGLQFRSRVLDPEAFRVGGYQADFDAAVMYDGTIYDEAGVAGDRGTMSNRGEATIWDSANKRHNRPLKERALVLTRAIKRGDWNDVVLLVRGRHIVYRINGHVMTDLLDNSPAALAEGILALQLHEGFTMDVRFKDVRLKALNE